MVAWCRGGPPGDREMQSELFKVFSILKFYDKWIIFFLTVQNRAQGPGFLIY